MNTVLQWLASEEWRRVVEALLHTLWLGGLVAVGVFLLLRKKTDPVVRYWLCVSGLVAVVLGGVVAWAVLEGATDVNVPSDVAMAGSAATSAGSSAVAPVSHSNPAYAGQARTATRMPGTHVRSWTCWLALVWLIGVTAMLARACSLVSEARQERSRSRPLENEAVLKLIEEARRKLGLVRQVRAVVTERLSSPAVMGVLTPVLILPLSIITTMPMGQLQFILLHELAHIRRGDYFVNLCQLVVESLLFFNPAVWWLSRQIRVEREACCDAMAIALAGERVEYARTLAQAVGVSFDAAPAFSERGHSSALKDRIQRLLVPGYRPVMQLTWLALLTALLVGSGLLFLSAVGARVTVAAILSPRERIERIEKKLTELGEPPIVENSENRGKKYKVNVSGRVRMADGSPVPERVRLMVHSSSGRSSDCSAVTAYKGVFSDSISAGTIYIGAEPPQLAPAFIGPLDGVTTNQLENLEIVFSRGFDVRLNIIDRESGAPVTNASVATMFWMPGFGLEQHSWKSGADGSVTLTHCSDMELGVTVNAPGYEITPKKFDRVREGTPLRLELKRGVVVSGVVLDKTSGKPISNAEFQLLYQTGAPETRRFQWDDPMRLLGRSDSRGAFVLSQLSNPARYWIGVRASGHESVMLADISPGKTDIVVRLGPELIVRGRVLGNQDGPQIIDGKPAIYRSWYEQYEDCSFGEGDWLPLHNGHFEFTNRFATTIKISDMKGGEVQRQVDAPVDDWVIDFSMMRPPQAKDLPKREVIFRFTHPSGVAPRGTVSVAIPDSVDGNRQTFHAQELQITNGEVRAEIAIGGSTSIEPKRMVGYWFDRWGGGSRRLSSIDVTNGAGPQIVEVPVIPAGVIYARASNSDGTSAGDVLFGVIEVKRAPGRADSTLSGTDDVAAGAPRKWVSGPLPLGGTYQIYCWRGNSFCMSGKVKLTEEKPDAELDLKFVDGQTFEGVLSGPDGNPMRDVEAKVSFHLSESRSCGLKSVITDANGRFRIENTTPDVGRYTIEVSAPGTMAEIIPLKFRSQPQTIRLKQGRVLAGRVVEAGSGNPIPDAQIRAFQYGHEELPMLSTRTDSNGRFEFTTLGNAEYTLYVGDAKLETNEKFRPGDGKEVAVPVTLYSWSKIKPKQ